MHVHEIPTTFLGSWSWARSWKCIVVPKKDWNMRRQRKKPGGAGRKKVMEKRGRDEDTVCVSNFETTANKSQSVALLKGDAWIISQCQVKWLPVPPPKKNSSPVLPPFCPPILSCHTVFSSTSSHRRVVVRWGGFIDAREARRLALTNELSGQTSSEWEWR